jgi:hypothetical protein
MLRIITKNKRVKFEATETEKDHYSKLKYKKCCEVQSKLKVERNDDGINKKNSETERRSRILTQHYIGLVGIEPTF